MAFTRPFAYNSGGPISGTTQFGDLAVGTPLTGFTDAPQFWNGPDEDLGYIITLPISGNSQPTPISGITASVGFYRTDGFVDSEFVQLAEIVSIEYGNPQTFISASDASLWLTNNGFWNSFIPLPTNTPTTSNTPTVTQTQTPTTTTTLTATPTQTPTLTRTQTPTPTTTTTLTATPTQTPTLTRTQTPTPSITASQTVTPTLTRTPTPTVPSTLVVYFDISNSSSYPGSGSLITDLSGAGNNGTLSGDYSYSSSNSGTIVMGGTNSIANINQNASINITSTSTPVSVVIWAKVPSGYANNDGLWNKQAQAGGYDGYRLSVGGTNGLVFGFNGNSQNYNTASASNVFTANTWAMFTTVIQAGTSYVYVNGNSTPVISQTTSDTFSGQPNLQIGQSIQGDGSYLPMTWGQFRYYKGKALSTAEILTLFNLDKTKYGL